jgi:hypothetical protein
MELIPRYGHNIQVVTNSSIFHVDCWIPENTSHRISISYSITHHITTCIPHILFVSSCLQIGYLPPSTWIRWLCVWVCVGITPLHHCYTSTRPDRYHYNEDNMHMGWWGSWRLVISLLFVGFVFFNVFIRRLLCVCENSCICLLAQQRKLGKTKRINTWLRVLEHDWCLTSPYAFSKPIHWYYSCV